jgi:HlyD family secretion protein
MTKKKKLLVFGVVAFFIIWIGAIFWANHNKESQSDSTDRKVAVYTIPDPQKIFGEGIFQYQNEVSFTPDASQGTVNKIHVQDGQKVDKGQLLFDYKNEQAIQQYQELEKELEALSALPVAAEDGEPIQQQEQAAAINRQLADLKGERYKNVTASFAGVVAIPSQSEGNTEEIMRLVDPKLRFVAGISERDRLKVEPGQQVLITLYSDNREIKGKITFVGNEPLTAGGEDLAAAVQNNLSTYPVHVEIDPEQQDGVYPGFHAQMEATPAGEVPRIPKTAVFDSDGQTFVWKVVDDKIHKTQITYSRWNDKYLNVLSGLEYGERIVRQADGEYKEGEKIAADSAED